MLCFPLKIFVAEIEIQLIYKLYIQKTWYIPFFLSSPEDMLIDFRERVREGERGREGERERNIDVREKDWCERETSIGYLLYMWRPNLQCRHVPWPGIEPASFQFMEQHSNQLSHTSEVDEFSNSDNLSVNSCGFSTYTSIYHLQKSFIFSFLIEMFIFLFYSVF